MEAAVVGMPHEKWGETPVAYVVLRAGDRGQRGSAQGALPRTHGALQGAERDHFVTELPKTATGKIQKYVLRKGQSAISRQ